jgi:adenosylhomocysteine nucleosidase
MIGGPMPAPGRVLTVTPARSHPAAIGSPATGGTVGRHRFRTFAMRLPPSLCALSLSLAAWAATPATASAAETLDVTPRTAVMSAFQPEWAALRAAVTDEHEHVVNGTTFVTGRLEGKDVVLFLTGVSMVNAAMTTQLALDRFDVRRIVFSGIAGGVDPSLAIGDVVVAERWGQYLEAVFARETPEGWHLPPFVGEPPFANYGMIFPQPVEIARAGAAPEERFWFEVDPAMLEVAREVAGQLELRSCAAPDNCLSRAPGIEVGGSGVSGQAFVDNAAFREYTFRTFEAKVLDMESAAVAQVAYANGVPFIAFRSLSDLAGGGEGENEIGTFFQLAADNSATVVRAFLRALP